jgi:hypothetical protein
MPSASLDGYTWFSLICHMLMTFEWQISWRSHAAAASCMTRTTTHLSHRPQRHTRQKLGTVLVATPAPGGIWKCTTLSLDFVSLHQLLPRACFSAESAISNGHLHVSVTRRLPTIIAMEKYSQFRDKGMLTSLLSLAMFCSS